MCGRYELKATAKALVRHCRHVNLSQPVMPYESEMRPAAPVLMLAGHRDGCFGRQARWGLVGHFLAAPPPTPPVTLCGEGLVAKPFYGKILQKNRCLIPATAFFEWQALAGGGKQAIRFSHAQGKPMMFAGVFDLHPVAGMTCAIVTTEANETVGPIHDRMPLILDPAQSVFWLGDYADFPADEFETLLQGASHCALQAETIPEPEISPQLAFAFS